MICANKDPTAISLENTLGISAAPGLLAELRDHRGRPLRIDASQVAHLGANCLQVLLSAAISWRQDEQPFQIVNCSSPFRDGVKVMGLDPNEIG